MSSTHPTPESSWQIKLFGCVEIVSPRGVAIRVTRKKPAELLAYLALHADRPQSRNRLAELIWRDTEVGDARTRLRQEISRLRTIIAEAGSDPGSTPFVVSSNDCGIYPGTVVDAARFRECMTVAAKMGEAELAAKQALLLEAMALYKCGELVEGIESSWLIYARSEFADLYAQAQAELVKLSSVLANEDPRDTINDDDIASLTISKPFTVLPGSANFEEEPSSREPVPSSPRALSAYQRFLFVGIAVLILCTTLSYSFGRLHKLNERANGDLQISSLSARSNTERWVYRYSHIPDELDNSEGKALVTDSSGIYVTGLIQTEKDDADILTLKLSHRGKLLWRDRYGSKEHDCDRAFSICTDGTSAGTVFVAGESYVPAGHGLKEGWRLTLIHYSATGVRLWVRRSEQIVHTIREKECVCSDRQGGCYLSGTELAQGEGHERIAILHYDSAGNLLWRRTLASSGDQAALNKAVTNSAGDLFLCGTTRKSVTHADAEYYWLTARLDASGNTAWIRKRMGQSTEAAMHRTSQ